MRVLDLFGGLGGFSQAFINQGHDVLRIENNPLLANIPNTHLMCVKEFRDFAMSQIEAGVYENRIDLIVASPPCLDFSLAYNAPRGKHQRENPDQEYDPSMELLECTLDIIQLLNPRFWVIENVKGAIKYFEPYLGKPKQIIGAYCFWGNFPELMNVGKIPSKKDKDNRNSPLRSNYRAEIPLQISMSLLIAILSQTYITDY